MTELELGSIGIALPNEFVDELGITTGGANAAYPGTTGGIASAITRSGSNELAGSVFATYTPGELVAPAKAIPVARQTIDVTSQLGYTAGFGVTLSGPIVKNHVWFFAGFAPQLARTDYVRAVESQTDCRRPGSSACDARYADGVPDVDPKSGFAITDTVDSEIREAPARSYPTIGRLDLAVTPEHQGTLSVIADPSSGEQPGSRDSPRPARGRAG